MPGPGGWQNLFNDYGNPSFMELLRREAPHLMPGAASPAQDAPPPEPPHGTTVLSVRYRDGVIMAGGRHATAGHPVPGRRLEQVLQAHELSRVGSAGVAGPAAELAKLFQPRPERHENVEGRNPPV